MKIVVACDSYKGCMYSKEVAQHIENGILKQNPHHEVWKYTIADGGEGTVSAFYDTCGGQLIEVSTVDAYMKKIKAQYTLIDQGQTAVMEAANIIGLNMYPREKRAPLFACSYGLGVVLLDAVKRGVKKVIIGLGGTATNDGGMGMLMALGVRFFDENHKPLPAQALSLEKIHYIDFNRMHKMNVELIAACDVANHLLGEQGATHVFGKQKGLYPNQIKKIERGMENYRFQLQRYLKVDINTFEGGGAAGGIGAILIGMLHAKMVPGIKLLLGYSNLEEKVAHCDLVVTGEGQTDKQTKFGKVPVGILTVANRYHKPTICISGALGLGYQDLYELGFIGLFSISDRAMTFQQALDNAPAKLEAATFAIINTIDKIKHF